MATKIMIDKTVPCVEAWLHGEHDYQFAKNEVTHQAHAANSRAYILMMELPDKWSRMQLFRRARLAETEPDGEITADTRLLLQVGQQALKVAAGSRAAFVWGRVQGGTSFDDANEESWEVLANYRDYVMSGDDRLPSTALLTAPIERAIKDYNRRPEAYGHVQRNFVGAVGLATTVLLEQSEYNGKVIMPEPGVPSGEVSVWDTMSVIRAATTGALSADS